MTFETTVKPLIITVHSFVAGVLFIQPQELRGWIVNALGATFSMIMVTTVQRYVAPYVRRKMLMLYERAKAKAEGSTLESADVKSE